jgi:hypothetical protein
MKNGIFLDEIPDSFTVVPYLVASWKHVIRRAGDVRAYLYRCPIRVLSLIESAVRESNSYRVSRIESMVLVLELCFPGAGRSGE